MTKRAVIFRCDSESDAMKLLEAGNVLGFRTSIRNDFESDSVDVRWIEEYDRQVFRLYEVYKGETIPRVLVGGRHAIQGPGKPGPSPQERQMVGQTDMRESRKGAGGGTPTPQQDRTLNTLDLIEKAVNNPAFTAGGLYNEGKSSE